jgi:hypothetical protein
MQSFFIFFCISVEATPIDSGSLLLFSLTLSHLIEPHSGVTDDTTATARSGPDPKFVGSPGSLGLKTLFVLALALQHLYRLAVCLALPGETMEAILADAL